jgi:hypothetical protein
MEMVGVDEKGHILWRYNSDSDFRRDLLEGIGINAQSKQAG